MAQITDVDVPVGVRRLLRRGRRFVEIALGRISLDQGAEKADHGIAICRPHRCRRGESPCVLAADGLGLLHE